MFKLYADKNKLALQEQEPITSGSRNIYTVHFSFSADWNELTKTAVFQYGEKNASVSLSEDGECRIPWEVLTSYGWQLMVGVYGTQDDVKVLPTVWASLGTVLQGASPEDTSAPSISPENWREVLDRKGDALTYTESGKLGLYSGERLLSSVLVDLGETVIPGDGLSKEGNTLSADNPVRGILTQGEYDALADAQKASGTYFVDDGTVPGPCWEIYSTQEQRIGTWIDGKPLYRKVFSGPVPSTSDVDAVSFDFTGKNIKHLYGAANGVPFNSYFAPGDYLLVWKRPNFIGISASAVYHGFTFNLTAEYTKTTDQATIELPAMLAVSQPLYTAAPQSAAAVELTAGIGNKEV